MTGGISGVIAAGATALGASAATAATIGTVGSIGLTVAGAGLTALSSVRQAQAEEATGKAQQAEENYQADEATQNAGQANAVGQRAAADQTRTAGFAESTANADAAASGGDTLSPSTVGVEQNIAAQGEYNTLSSLYSGQSKANAYLQQASTDTYQGQLDRTTGNIKADSTLATGGISMLMKYGNAFTPSGASGASTSTATGGPGSGVGFLTPEQYAQQNQ